MIYASTAFPVTVKFVMLVCFAEEWLGIAVPSIDEYVVASYSAP